MVDPKKIIECRHPLYGQNSQYWQYFADAAEGGPAYPMKVNPLFRPLIGYVTGGQQQGSNRYVTQHSLEDSNDYLTRLYRCPTVNICDPAISMLAGTVGSPDSVVFDVGTDYKFMLDDADLMGDSLLQFIAGARAHACTYGHTFLLVDSTKASRQIVTEADVIAEGIRPYVREIIPQDMLTWRLDANGKPVEVLFRVPVEAPGSILDAAAPADQQFEYRFWSRQNWIVYRQLGEDVIVSDSGQNPLGEIPVVCLFHKRVQPFLGESLIKEASKYQQLLTCMLSGLDVVTSMQSFSQACLRSENPPSQVAVGATKVVHLHPAHKDDAGGQIGEADFFFRSPDPGPLDVMWRNFYQLIDTANASMSLSPDATVDKSHPESGVSRAWRWHSAERRLTTMSTNEQEAVKGLFYFAARWKGQDNFNGTIQYSTHYDLTALEDDITNMLSLQAASIPQSAQTEMKSRVIRKALPNLAPNKQSAIDAELKKMNSVQSMIDRRVTEDAFQNQG